MTCRGSYVLPWRRRSRVCRITSARVALHMSNSSPPGRENAQNHASHAGVRDPCGAPMLMCPAHRKGHGVAKASNGTRTPLKRLHRMAAAAIREARAGRAHLSLSLARRARRPRQSALCPKTRARMRSLRLAVVREFHSRLSLPTSCAHDATVSTSPCARQQVDTSSRPNARLSACLSKWGVVEVGILSYRQGKKSSTHQRGSRDHLEA